MNYIQLLTSILNNTNLSFLNGGRKKNNKGIMWASIFGVIISIVAIWLRRKPETLQPIQNIVGDFKEKNLNPLTKFQHNPAFAEFSTEIKPNIDSDNPQN